MTPQEREAAKAVMANRESIVDVSKAGDCSIERWIVISEGMIAAVRKCQSLGLTMNSEIDDLINRYETLQELS